MTPEEIALKTLTAAQQQADAARAQVFWSQVQALSNFALALIPVGVALWQIRREGRLAFDASHDFRGKGGGASIVQLFSLNGRSVHVAHWQLEWRRRLWYGRIVRTPVSAMDTEFGDAAFDIEPYGRRVIMLGTDFDWSLKPYRRRLSLVLTIAGARQRYQLTAYDSRS